jgi:hypothetical protein
MHNVKVRADLKSKGNVYSKEPAGAQRACRMRGGFDIMKLAIAIMVIALVASMAIPCLAGNNLTAKSAVHVRAHNAKLACSVTIADCNDIVTTEAGFSVDAFPIFYQLTEYLGVQYGLTWPAWTYSAAFTSCSDLVIGTVTTPGTGAAHTWTACQAEGIAIPSFVWLYADGPGYVCLSDYPESDPPGLYVLDCSEGLDTPVWSICAGVYGEVGDDACEPATEAATWSAIKKIFK